MYTNDSGKIKKMGFEKIIFRMKKGKRAQPAFFFFEL